MAEERTHPDPTEHGPPEHPEKGHEASDVNVKAILWFAAGMAVAAVVIHLGLAWLFFAFKGMETRQKASEYPLGETGRPLPPPPMLEGVQRREAVGGAAPQERDVVEGGDLSRRAEVKAVEVERAFKRLERAGRLRARPGAEGRTWRDLGRSVPYDANSGRGPKEMRR